MAASLRAVDEHQYAHVSSVADFAAELPDRYLQCRDVGHNWKARQAGRYRDGGYRVMHRCSSCGTKRIRELTSGGMILSNQYIHPTGYLAEGIGRIVGEGRGVLRIASITRIIKDEDEELDRG